MSKTFKRGHHVEWNSEAGRVHGTVVNKVVPKVKIQEQCEVTAADHEVAKAFREFCLLHTLDPHFEAIQMPPSRVKFGSPQVPPLPGCVSKGTYASGRLNYRKFFTSIMLDSANSSCT